MAKSSFIGEPAKREIVITRVFNAPLALVWRAWTDPEYFKRWWGPKDYTSPFCQMDLREGGKYLNSMKSPDGREYWSTGVFREIIPLKRLVYTDSFSDADGNVVPATHYGLSAEFPLEMLVTVLFEEFEGKTKLTVHHVGIPSGADSAGAEQGWNESFDKLAETLQ